MTEPRRHVSIHIPGDTARDLDAWRERWDPVMAARTPPHVTVVYPEEIVDELLLLARLDEVAADTSPFALHLSDVRADDGGSGGVFVAVADHSGALETIRDRLLLPPQHFSGYPFHSTIAHPRTSVNPTGCWRALQGLRLDCDASVHELLYTVTDHAGRRVLSRHRLRGGEVPPRIACAGAVLVAGRQVLLGLRGAGRQEFPGVWDIPGGHVEVGESPRRALVRELREELAIDAVVGAPWCRVVDEVAGELTIWLVQDWLGTVVNAAPHEHSELRWCDATDIAELPLADPALRALLLDALEGC